MRDCRVLTVGLSRCQLPRRGDRRQTSARLLSAAETKHPHFMFECSMSPWPPELSDYPPTRFFWFSGPAFHEGIACATSSAQCDLAWRCCRDRQEHLRLRARPSSESGTRDAATLSGAAPVLRDGAVPLPAVEDSAPDVLRPQGSADAACVGCAARTCDDGPRLSRPTGE